MIRGYQWLRKELEFDSLVLVDGGTDALMRGDEAGLGTPAEDVASVLAAETLDLERKFLVCLGFGVDRYHGVCHAHFLEAVSALSREGGFLGAWSLNNDDPAVQSYLHCVDYAQNRMPGRESIVNASVGSAIRGHYGDHHVLRRTRKYSPREEDSAVFSGPRKYSPEVQPERRRSRCIFGPGADFGVDL